MSMIFGDRLTAFEEALGHRFSDRNLLQRALTHSSYANESARVAEPQDNETLEFLGDSILGFLVAEQLFHAFPDFREGALSKARSHLVSEAHFASLARRLGLGDLVLLAVGESRSGGRVRDSLLADAFEALFAALYLDAGLEKTREIVGRLFRDDIDRLDPADISFRDYKTALQEMVQAEGKPLPRYLLLEESGPAHDRRFVYEVAFEPGHTAVGSGGTKKEAQRQAAKAALNLLMNPSVEDGR
jgi:ribonuclease-3